jgi:hypothetical protein
MLCGLVDRYCCFGEVCPLHLQEKGLSFTLKVEAASFSKTPVPTSIYYMTSQKRVILIFFALRSSDLK